MQVTGVSLPGAQTESNADVWGHVNQTVWVLDGAHQPPGTGCCEFSERSLVTRADRALRDLAPLFGSDLRGLLQVVTRQLTSTHLEHHVGPLGPGPAATIALLHVGNAMEWLLLGDAGVYLDGALIVDDRLEGVAMAERHAWLASKGEKQGHHGLWMDLYRAELKVRNQEDGYWVLTADGVDASTKALIGSTNLQDALLCTDGFYSPWEAAKEGLGSDPISFLKRNGVHQGTTELRREQRGLGWRSDDMTVVLVETLA